MGILILPWLKTKLSGHDNLQRRLLPLFEPVDAYLGGHRVNKLWYSSLRVLDVIFLILLQLFLYLRFVLWCKNSTSTRSTLYLSYYSDYESHLNIIWEDSRSRSRWDRKNITFIINSRFDISNRPSYFNFSWIPDHFR